MRNPPRPPRARLFSHALAAVISVAGCTTPKANGPGDAAAAAVATTCGHGCTVDECAAAEAGVEFFADVKGVQRPILNLEGGTAQFMYSYMDGTSALTPSAYNPPASPATRCVSPSNQFEFHITGGPFLAWGGGMGVAMAHLNAMETNLCPDLNRPDYCPPLRTGDPVSNAALDMSKYDGVSFWARRGPTSQPLLRVLVGDKFTDDDISYLADLGDPDHTQPRFCERIKECGCFYQNLTCAPYAPTVAGVYPDGGYYCGEPGKAPAPAVMAPTPNGNDTTCSDGTDGGKGPCATNTCNHTRCDEIYPAYPGNGPDPKFVGRPCTAYVFRNGIQTSICYDPAKDPPPPQPNELCGDFWTYPVTLSTEWQFFKVPFSIMYQQGWAKKAPYFDTHSVSVVRFTWDSGLIDYYVDDVRFYRAKR